MSEIKRLEVSEDEWNRLMALRSELFSEIKRLLKEDGHCKSYEGAFSIRRALPNYFDGEDHDNPSDWRWATICDYCYVADDDHRDHCPIAILCHLVKDYRS